MLDQHQVRYRYREYTREPFSLDELRRILAMLELGPRDVLRTRDKAYRELGLDGSESDEVLLAHMVEHPTLVQRPIGVLGGRAALGRPVENLLALLE